MKNRESEISAKETDEMKKILLVGNPNVGKSAIFTRLTGVHALSSNYPGTTVGFLEGWLIAGKERFRLIDVPGVYTLDPSNEAEAVAERIIDEGADLVLLVLDATALERNLFLAFQVMERGLNVMVVLNMIDETRHKGITIDVENFEKLLGVPVVPTVGVTGEGISKIIERIPETRVSSFPQMTKEERWSMIGDIVGEVQTVVHRHHTLKDRLEDVSVDPVWGAVLGIFILATSFYLVRLVGEGLINYILDPLFSKAWVPLLEKLSAYLHHTGLLHHMLIGTLFDGSIDLEQSFGILSTGLYVPIVMVLPYVISFYGVLSFLEDWGYLPRLAVIFDALMHRLGLHGFAIVPALLGLGCNVPGIIATRVLESQRERFIAATLISVAIPCAGLQAMIIGVLGDVGMRYVLLVYASLFAAWITIGRILHLTLHGYSPELIVEIPPYRLPNVKAFFFKLWFRTKAFLIEAIPLVLVGVMIVNLLYMSNLLNVLAAFLSPIFKGLLGLPPETAGPILLGMLRKDVAVGMLVPLGLTPAQLVVATVTLSMTFPCIATFVVLWKELGSRKMFASLSIMIISALVAGTTLRVLLSFTTF